MNQTQDLAARMATPRSRDSRSESFATRFTKAELAILSRAAAADGMKAREWAREALLKAARQSDDALFTELVATRMLMVNLLKPLILGKQVSQDWITEAMAAVRREKRKAARELMQQYTEETAGGQ
jgi:hypothetical protein